MCIGASECVQMVEGGMLRPPCLWRSCAMASLRMCVLMGSPMRDISTFQLGRRLAKESSSMMAMLKWSPHWSAMDFIVR